jgi:RimJ/RimL family protein N-acetyltransferase
MPPKVLRRCAICQRLNASYRVDDPELGPVILCRACRDARQAAHAPPGDTPQPGAIAPVGPLVEPAGIARYRAFFPGPHLALVLASIEAGNTLGQLWTFALAEGTLALLWDKGNNVFVFSGGAGTPAARRALANLIATQVRPQALAEGALYFRAYALSPVLHRVLPKLFAGTPLHPNPTAFLAYRAATPPSVPPPAVPGVVLAPIDAALLGRDDLAHLEQVPAEIRWMWPSEARFFEVGFGVVALLADQVIGWCTAEYVGPTSCGIGITTVPAYERRGVATALAACLIAEALRRGLTPHWECGQGNRASLRVAEKLGFVRLADEQHWQGKFTA